MGVRQAAALPPTALDSPLTVEECQTFREAQAETESDHSSGDEEPEVNHSGRSSHSDSSKQREQGCNRRKPVAQHSQRAQVRQAASEDSDPPTPRRCSTLQGPEEWLRHIRGLRRASHRHLVVVHLYSGERRRGDFED